MLNVLHVYNLQMQTRKCPYFRWSKVRLLCKLALSSQLGSTVIGTEQRIQMPKTRFEHTPVTDIIPFLLTIKAKVIDALNV